VLVSDAERSEQQQLARNLAELLQELRVAQAGVQILFGFLLSVAFTDRYARADGYVHVTHLVTVLLATAATALLTAPAAWHRVLFRRGRRERLIAMATKSALAGLVCLALAVSGTVLLITEVVIGGWSAIAIAAAAAVGFGALWFLWPVRERARGPAPERVDAVPSE
jgi:hypothetical protein